MLQLNFVETCYIFHQTFEILPKTGLFLNLKVAPSGGSILTFSSFFIRNCVYNLFLVHYTIKDTLGFGLKLCPKIFFHKKGVSVLFMLSQHSFSNSVECNVWSTILSHPNSQNNNGPHPTH